MTPCEVCGGESIAVASVPGVPFSVARCRTCIEDNAYPWAILVANTACCGGLEGTNDGWREMVDATCLRLRKTIVEFNADVERGLRELENYEPPIVDEDTPWL